MIKVKNLEKKFGKTAVLRDISFKVNRGEIVAILGPSGSGKSTILRSINLIEEPTQGEIWIRDKLITKNTTNVSAVREKVGMVFQHFNLFPHMTVMGNMTFAPIKVKKLNKDVAEKKAEDLLARVGLADKKNSYPEKLSGGQKQRVAIARALAMDPEILLFDEPTSALDPEMVKEVLDVIRQVCETGMTVMIVTHEMEFARQLADRILFLDNGVILEDTTPKEFFSKPKTERGRSFLEKVL